MNRMLTVLGMVFLLVAGATRALAADYNWASAVTGNWNTASLWDRNNWYPGYAAGDTATIDAVGSAYTVTLNVTPGNSLDAFGLNSANATFQMNRWLNVAGSADLDLGQVTMITGSGFSGAGTLTNNVDIEAIGVVGISTGDFVQNGLVTILAGPSGYKSTFTVANAFDNDGTITLTSVDNVRTATLAVTAGTLTNSASGIINVNEGAGGARYLTTNFVNDGTVNVNDDLSLNRSAGLYTNNAAFNVSAGDTVSVSGGSIVRFTQAGGTLDNQGAFLVTSEQFDFDGGTITGNQVILNGGRLNIGPGSTGSGAFELRGVVTYSGDVASGQTVTVYGGPGGVNTTLSAPNGFTNSGLITLTSQEYDRTATLQVTTGSLTNNAGGIINIEEGLGGPRYLTADLVNDGTVNVNDDLSLNQSSGSYTNNAAFNVSSGDTVTVSSSGIVTFTQAAGTLDNQGTFLVSGEQFDFNGGTITGNQVILNGGWLNIGPGSTGSGEFELRGIVGYSGDVASGQTVTVYAGPNGVNATTTAAGGFSNSGTIALTSQTMARTATLSVTTGALTNNAGGIINVNEGVGGLRYLTADLVNDGTVNVNHDLSLNRSAGLYTNNAAFNVSAGDTVTVSGSSIVTFTQAGGTLDNQGTFLVSAERFDFDGGSITGNAVILNGGWLNIGPGSTGSGAFELRGLVTYSGDVASGQTVTVYAGPNGVNATTTAASGFSNSGTIALTSQTVARTATLSLATGAFTNSATGVFDIDPGIGGTRLLYAEFANAGLFDVDFSLLVTRNNALHVNTGLIDLATGAALEITGSGAISLTNAPGGIIQGAGTLDVDDPQVSFINDGLVSPGLSPGVLTFSGDYVQSATGRLLAEIGGYTVGSDYDRLVVLGAADLAGLLDVDLWGGFAPIAGDTFTVLTATGGLNDLGLQLAGEDRAAWDLLWTADELGVEYVPEPMTMSLLGLGGLALLRRRKS